MLNKEGPYPIDSIAGNLQAYPYTSCPIQYLKWLTYIVYITQEFAFQNLYLVAISQQKFYDAGWKSENTNRMSWYGGAPLAALKLGFFGWTGRYKVKIDWLV